MLLLFINSYYSCPSPTSPQPLPVVKSTVPLSHLCLHLSPTTRYCYHHYCCLLPPPPPTALASNQLALLQPMKILLFPTIFHNLDGQLIVRPDNPLHYKLPGCRLVGNCSHQRTLLHHPLVPMDPNQIFKRFVDANVNGLAKTS